MVGPDLYNIGFTNIVFSTVSDSDGDGVPDNLDLCPNSILTPTVIVGGTDTGITNTVDADGCSIADLIQIASDNAKNHGAFVSAVAKLANDLKSSGAISGKQAGKLKSAAAKAK